MWSLVTWCGQEHHGSTSLPSLTTGGKGKSRPWANREASVAATAAGGVAWRGCLSGMIEGSEWLGVRIVAILRKQGGSALGILDRSNEGIPACWATGWNAFERAALMPYKATAAATGKESRWMVWQRQEQSKRSPVLVNSLLRVAGCLALDEPLYMRTACEVDHVAADSRQISAYPMCSRHPISDNERWGGRGAS